MLSYPGPDRSVRLDHLQAGRADPRRYRNRRIGELWKELDLNEGRGTGIPKILRAMKNNGSPPPEFEFDQDHSYFLVRLPVHPDVPGGRTDQVTGEVARLLAVLEGEMSRIQLQAALDLRHEDHFRHGYLVPALEAGLVEMTIPDKPRSRNQR